MIENDHLNQADRGKGGHFPRSRNYINENGSYHYIDHFYMILCNVINIQTKYEIKGTDLNGLA